MTCIAWWASITQPSAFIKHELWRSMSYCDAVLIRINQICGSTCSLSRCSADGWACSWRFATRASSNTLKSCGSRKATASFLWSVRVLHAACSPHPDACSVLCRTCHHAQSLRASSQASETVYIDCQAGMTVHVSARYGLRTRTV